jgi:uncharacterized protein (TIGR02265 family)
MVWIGPAAGGHGMAERYIYGVAVEAFFLRSMSGRLDDATRAALRETGIDVDAPLLAAYPATVFHRAVRIAACAAYPGVGDEEALFRAGLDHIDAFVQTYPGKMMLALARQIEPRTILEYTATFIRLGNNFTEARVRSLGPARVEIWMNDVGDVPDWYRGIIARGLERSLVKGSEVRLVAGVSPPEARLDVSWVGR